MVSAARTTFARYSVRWKSSSVSNRALKRQGQEEAGQELHAGLKHPEFLQQLRPVAVHLLVERLVPVVTAGLIRVCHRRS